jgi:membrane dipeptidase
MNQVFTGPSSILAKMIGYSGKSFLYEKQQQAAVSNNFDNLGESSFMGGFFEIFIPPISTPILKQTDEGFEADYPAMQEYDDALKANLRECSSFLRNDLIRQEKINWLRSKQELNNLATDSRPALILHLADADAIDEKLEMLDIFYALGVRSMGITWSRQNQFGYGAPYKLPGHPDSGPGLTNSGIQLVKKCNALGILIDNAHLNEAGFKDVAENSSKPLVISHGTPHALNPSSRSFTDDMLRTVADTNGMVGISLEGVKETSEGYANDMVRHIEYVIEKVGDSHVGFGSDMLQPQDATGPVKTLLPEIISLLTSKKYTQQTIDRIAYQNWQRVLNETLV